jgi:hypothetical protein
MRLSAILIAFAITVAVAPAGAHAQTRPRAVIIDDVCTPEERVSMGDSCVNGAADRRARRDLVQEHRNEANPSNSENAAAAAKAWQSDRRTEGATSSPASTGSPPASTGPHLVVAPSTWTPPTANMCINPDPDR